jgi:Zn-dependent protease
MKLPYFKTRIFTVSPGAVIAAVLLYILNDDAYFFIMLLSVLIHELGHIISCMLLGQKIEQIRFGIAGAQIDTSNKLSSYVTDAVTSLSGPAASIGAAVVSFLIIRERTKLIPLDSTAELLLFFFLSNLFYALVNLIPVKGLDGGNALYALAASKLELHTADRIVTVSSFVSVFVILAVSLTVLKNFDFNFSLVILIFSLLFDLIPKKTILH